MKKMIINENQKGFLFKNGKYIKLLDAGKYHLFGGREIEIVGLDQPIACGKCAELKRCVFANDAVNDFAEKAKTSDGFVFGSPVYYAHPSGRIQSFLDRLFFSTMNADRYASLRHKPCASIVVARRAGTSASFDVLNKYATISQMIVVGSTYWNEFHALTKEDVPKDPEGLQTLQNLARNMVYVMKCLKAGRDAGIREPENESAVLTNFVR